MVVEGNGRVGDIGYVELKHLSGDGSDKLRIPFNSKAVSEVVAEDL